MSVAATDLSITVNVLKLLKILYGVTHKKRKIILLLAASSQVLHYKIPGLQHPISSLSSSSLGFIMRNYTQ